MTIASIASVQPIILLNFIAILKGLSQSYVVLGRIDAGNRIQVAAQIDANRSKWRRVKADPELRCCSC